VRAFIDSGSQRQRLIEFCKGLEQWEEAVVVVGSQDASEYGFDRSTMVPKASLSQTAAGEVRVPVTYWERTRKDKDEGESKLVQRTAHAPGSCFQLTSLERAKRGMRIKKPKGFGKEDDYVICFTNESDQLVIKYVSRGIVDDIIELLSSSHSKLPGILRDWRSE
jgi:hypothetical protein